jgi:murein DD-endopeptidase MepM/ murein hydrolase activator NlpD
VPREQATGVFRILICLILAAGPSAVPALIAGPTTRSAHATPIELRGFHPPTFRYGPGHRGVDLAAAAGEPVLAAGAGTVMFAGVVAGRGVVSLGHLGGLHTTYEPVSVTVTVGQRVSRGEQIATVQSGHPGCPVVVCLHWGAFRGPDATEPGDADRQYVDPLRLVLTPRVRLLPIQNPSDRS